MLLEAGLVAELWDEHPDPTAYDDAEEAARAYEEKHQGKAPRAPLAVTLEKKAKNMERCVVANALGKGAAQINPTAPPVVDAELLRKTVEKTPKRVEDLSAFRQRHRPAGPFAEALSRIRPEEVLRDDPRDACPC